GPPPPRLVRFGWPLRGGRLRLGQLGQGPFEIAHVVLVAVQTERGAELFWRRGGHSLSSTWHFPRGEPSGPGQRRAPRSAHATTVLAASESGAADLDGNSRSHWVSCEQLLRAETLVSDRL